MNRHSDFSPLFLFFPPPRSHFSVHFNFQYLQAFKYMAELAVSLFFLGDRLPFAKKAAGWTSIGD